MRQALLLGSKLKRVLKNSVIKIMFQCNIFLKFKKKIKILKTRFTRTGIRVREVGLS